MCSQNARESEINAENINEFALIKTKEKFCSRCLLRSRQQKIDADNGDRKDMVSERERARWRENEKKETQFALSTPYELSRILSSLAIAVRLLI